MTFSRAQAAGLALTDPALVVDQEEGVERAIEHRLELAVALAKDRFGLEPHGLLLVEDLRLLVHLLEMDDPIVDPRHPGPQGVIEEQGNRGDERQEPPSRPAGRQSRSRPAAWAPTKKLTQSWAK